MIIKRLGADEFYRGRLSIVEFQVQSHRTLLLSAQVNYGVMISLVELVKTPFFNKSI